MLFPNARSDSFTYASHRIDKAAGYFSASATPFIGRFIQRCIMQASLKNEPCRYAHARKRIRTPHILTLQRLLAYIEGPIALPFHKRVVRPSYIAASRTHS